MDFRSAKTAGLAVLLVATMILSASAVMFSDGSDAAVSKATKDAIGNDLEASYDTSSIMTIGVGTLRWVCYFGHSDDVVCIDAGDANAASWNGKAYRSLFDFDQAGLVSNMSGASINPVESHVSTYGMACHDHNGFSTANLEKLNDWTSAPKVTIVSKTAWNNFDSAVQTGLPLKTKVVVIEEVDSFMDSEGNLSAGFSTNLSILAAVFNDTTRADELASFISSTVSDIKSLVSGKTAKFSAAYVGSASNAGAKTLNWSVGSYVPFELAGVNNGYDNSNSTATNAGSEAMSKANPKVIFADLSGTAKYSAEDSAPILTYAELNKTPIYTILPYFWFGFNFDNALADAYLVIYACYDGVMTFEQCQSKIKAVYQGFFPEMSDGQTALTGFDTYYSGAGSHLTLDGKAYNYENSAFKAVDRPAGDVTPSSANDGGLDIGLIAIAGAVIIIAVAAVAMVAARSR